MTATTTHQVEALISPTCRKVIEAEIESIHGGEVFFVGRLGADGRIEDVEAYAFGNRNAVPALLQYARPGDVILHNHPSGRLEPSAADIDIAAAAGELGIGAYIIDNACARLRVVVKPARPEPPGLIDVEALAASLEPGGRLAERLEGYEHRPMQVEMLREVARAFNEGRAAAIEAGTGTGKSMAYLLPAIAWSLRNGERVVVATHTINLQEQLLEKDLPLLKRALDLEFDVALLKGRGNYLCRRKAEYVAAHPDFLASDDKGAQMSDILAWSRRTADGSLADLGFEPEPEVWERVMSESDNCLRTQCPFYQTCFFYNARRRAARAHLLVVNHHLLMADVAVRALTDNHAEPAVLPPFERLILDEAHHAEDVATEYFGARVSRYSLIYLLNRLAAQRTGDGLLRYLAGRLHDGTYRLGPEAARTWQQRLAADLLELRRELFDAIEEATDRAAIALDQLAEASAEPAGDIRRRLTPEILESPTWASEIEAPWRAVILAARPLIEGLRGLLRTLQATLKQETPETMSPLLELKSLIFRLEGHLADVVRFLGGAAGTCRWVEYRRRAAPRRPILALCVAPLDVGPEFRRRVLERYRTVLMTSATLTVEGRFDFYLSRIGGLSTRSPGRPKPREANEPTTERIVETLRLETPFDFERQVYVGVPVSLPSPKEPAFAPALADFLDQALRITEGRALLLFTAYAMLNEVHARLAPSLEAAGFPCLKQGAVGRSLLTESFRNGVGSVLFATSSFWEGVDVPGEALSCLVLARLPFVVPRDPLIEARVEAMAETGLDPFVQYIVPRAVLRFRQGFGRLIRRRDDRGAVLIADPRVARQSYGRMFLGSLPVSRPHIAPAGHVLAALERFFHGKAGPERAPGDD